MRLKINYRIETKVWILSLFLTLFSCYKLEEKSNLKSVKNSDLSAKSVIEDFVITQTVSGQPVWKIFAKKAEVQPDNNSVIIYNGVMKIFNKKNFFAEVKFNTAIINLKTKDVECPKENVIHTIENERIITYNIKYIFSENKIFSDDKITIYRNGNVIKGRGFETFDNFQTIKIKENIIVPE